LREIAQYLGRQANLLGQPLCRHRR
jgi:hypothetical protein